MRIVNRTISTCVMLSISSSLFAQNSLVEQCVASKMLDSFENIGIVDPNKGFHRTEGHLSLETNATLYRVGKNGTRIPQLAKSYEIDSERKVITIELDTTCRWSDGKPIKSKEILRGVQRTIEPSETRAHPLPNLKNVEAYQEGNASIDEIGVRAISEYQLEFDLISEPEYLLEELSSWLLTPVPSHIPEDEWLAAGLTRLTSGAFKVSSYTDDKIEMLPNEYFCEGNESNTQKAVIYGVSGRKHLSRLMNQDLVNIGDVIGADAFEDLKQLDDFSQRWNLVQDVPYVMSYMAFNVNGLVPPKSDIQKAFLLAIDFDSLERQIGIDGLYGRRLNSLNFDFNDYKRSHVGPEFLEPYESRLAEAKEIMRSLGYGPDNMLNISFAIRNSSPYEQLGFAVRSMLNNAYIEATPKVIRKQAERVKFDVAVNAWGLSEFDPVPTLIAFQNMANANDLNWVQDEMTHLNTHADRHLRHQKASMLEARIMDSRLVFPLFEVLSPTVISKGIRQGSQNHMIASNMIFENGCEPLE